MIFYKPEIIPDHIEGAVLPALADWVPSLKWCFTLSGDAGIGKTWAAVKWCEASPLNMRYIKARHYVEQVRREIGTDRDGDTQDKCMGVARGSFAGLLLDDLGAERVTDFAAGKIADLLDERYDRQLPTLITTNNSIDDLSAAYGARTASRLASGIVLVMSGKDRRLAR